MSIQIFCPKCKTSSALTAKVCGKCQKPFDRTRKYRVQVSVKGQRQTRVVENLTIARELETSIKADMVREEFDITHHKTKKSPTLNDVWAKFLPWAKEHKKSWKDDEWYYHRHLEPRFGAKALDAITPMDIERMKSELRKSTSKNNRPYAPATIKHQIVILRRLFNLAVKWRIYEGANPVSSVQIPKLDNQVNEYLTPEQFQKLMDTLDGWPFREPAILIKFAAFTGIRRGELFKLSWDDVDFGRQLLTLRDPKGTKTETIPASSEALGMLKDLDATSTYVFPGPGGKMRTSIRDNWNVIKKHADIAPEFRFHGLRHSYASWLISNGVDLAVVQKLMSHKHAVTTMRYAHMMPGTVKDAATKSGKLFSSAGKKSKKVFNLNNR